MKKMDWLLALALVMAFLFVPAPAKADAFYMARRNYGVSCQLTGKVELVEIFVNTPESIWTAKQISQFVDDTRTAIGIITKEAKRYGASLELGLAYADVTIAHCLDSKDDDPCYRDIMDYYGYDNMKDLHDNWEAYYGVDDIALLFVFNQKGRSYSHVQEIDEPWNAEYAVIYGKSVSRKNNVTHELLHLFGAIDLYYPDEIARAAKKLCPKSVMLTGDTKNVDDFNAYLIGWTSIPNAGAWRFMNAIRHVTSEDVAAGLRKQWE